MAIDRQTELVAMPIGIEHALIYEYTVGGDEVFDHVSPGLQIANSTRNGGRLRGRKPEAWTPKFS